MATCVSTKSGNWSDPTVWSPTGVPGASDTVTIATTHVVTVDVPSSAVSVSILAHYVSGLHSTHGLLQVNSSLTLTLTTGTALTYLGQGEAITPVCLALGPGGSIIGSPTTGNTVLFQLGSGNNNQSTCTAYGTGWGTGEYCEFKNAGAGTLSIYGSDGASNTDNANFLGSYVKFTNINGGLIFTHLNGTDANSGFVVDHALFSGCGTVSFGCGAGAAFRLNDVQFSGSVGTYAATLTIVAASAGVERTHDLVVYDLPMQLTTAALSFTNSLFYGDIVVPGSGTWLDFNGCLLRRSSTQAGTACPGPVTNSYILYDYPGQGNPHFITNSHTTGWTITGCIFEGPAVTWTGDIGDLILGPLGPTTVTNCLVVPIATGAYAGSAPGIFVSCGGASTTSITQEHCTVVGTQGNSYYGETYAGYAGMYASYKANLFVDLTSAGTGYKFTVTHGSSVMDGCYAANATNNGGYGLAAGSAGNGYNYSVSTGTPGLNDVNANPNFVDPTRNFPTWAVSQGSTGSTVAEQVADGLAYMIADPSLIASSLNPWVRAGFVPTNPAFQGTAHDGTDIGAIAYQDSGPPSLTVATPSLTVVGPHEIDLSWAAATGGTSPYSYQVQRAPDSAYTNLGTAGTSLTFSDTQLDPGVTYHYQIVVTDSSSSPLTVTSAEAHATTVLPDIPNYALWWSRMASYPSTFDPGLIATPDSGFDENNEFNHDGIYGAIQSLGYRPGNTDLTTYLAQQLRLYRDDYVVVDGGAVDGYYIFPEGLGLDWEQNGSTASRDALISIVQYGHFVSQPDENISWEGLSRENAYSLLAWIEVDRLGLVAWDQSWVSQLVDNALGDIGLWLGDPAVWTASNSSYIQPFMMGITGIALGKYLDYIEAHKSTTDARILPALSAIAVRMRERWWRPTSSDFIWPIYLDGTDHSPTTDHTVLNLESTNFFGWLYHRTGSNYFKTAGDEAFSSGIATTEIYNPKQWNQQYRWSFLYVGWREATPGTDNGFYVLDPPFIPNGTTGVASSPFIVAPLTAITGTITPNDGGAGGSFTPSFLTFAGSSTPASFTYTPAVVGTATISVTNTAGLTDPATVGYQAQAPTPIPTTVPTPIPATTKKILFPT